MSMPPLAYLPLLTIMRAVLMPSWLMGLSSMDSWYCSWTKPQLNMLMYVWNEKAEAPQTPRKELAPSAIFAGIDSDELLTMWRQYLRRSAPSGRVASESWSIRTRVVSTGTASPRAIASMARPIFALH